MGDVEGFSDAQISRKADTGDVCFQLLAFMAVVDFNEDKEGATQGIPTLERSDGTVLPLDEKQIDRKSDSFEVADALEGDSLKFLGDDDAVVLLNGEPVITGGKDVSRFVVDIRDDGEAALTLRSVVLGTIFAGLGAALCQVKIHVAFITYPTNPNTVPDLLVQAGPNDGVDGVLVTDHIYLWKCLGELSSKTVLGVS